MTILQLALLALVQGITEFLPVSSSGHLILLPTLLGIEDQGQAIDIAVHVGTLGAVMIYFWRDMLALVTGSLKIVTGNFKSPESKLVLLLILATIPVMIAGVILKMTGLSDAMRSIRVIGWSMLIFGLVLYWADLKHPAERQATEWSLRDAIIMGLWQAVALIPGTSRSGATITASRILGFERRDGARLAMLMSIPTIIASATLIGLDVYDTVTPEQIRDLALAAAMAFVAALLALFLMMKLLGSVNYTPYVIYRIILGLILLYIGYR